MKKTFVLITMLIGVLVAHGAEPVEIDGIYYRLDIENKTAKVSANPIKYKFNVVIPDKIVYNGDSFDINEIEFNAFENCTSLSSVTLPNSIICIGESAFRNCNLETIVIPNSVTKIGVNAFRECRMLKSIKLPDNLKVLEDLTFANSGLETVILPDGLTTIGESVFNKCYNLTSINVPNSVTSIGSGAFAYCYDAPVTIPTNLEYLGSGAYCSSGIVSIDIPNSITNVGPETFINCVYATSISISNSMSALNLYAFCNCAFESVVIPDNIKNIESGALLGCPYLKTISIGNGVRTIDNGAFGRCESLEKVYCYSKNVPQTHSNAFVETPIENATLFVPEESLKEYTTTLPWSLFGKIDKIQSTDIYKIGIEENSETIFSVDGILLGEKKKGINIIRKRNGKTKKVFLK